MFHKLKQCKTIKEIYEVLGNKPFEIVALLIIFVWVTMPLISTIGQLEIGLNSDYELAQKRLVISDYQNNVKSIGFFSLEFALIFLLGRILINKGQVKNKVKSEPWHYSLVLMLVWACISTILSDDPHTAFWGTEYRFDGLLTYFFYAAVYICAVIVINSQSRKWIFIAYTMVGNVVSVLLVLQDWGSELLNKCFMSDRAAMFFHFNHAGYFLCMSIAALMGMYLYEKKRVIRILYVISMIVQVYGLLVNSTLGGYLGITCALIMILIFLVRKNKRFAWRMITPVLVIVLLAVASYMGYVPTGSGEDMKVNISTMLTDTKGIVENSDYALTAGHGRMTLWKRSLKMIPERPIFGYGPELLKNEYMEDLWTDRASNEFIQYAVFLGIPGLIFYLTALICLFIHQWKNIEYLNTVTLVAAGCVIAYLVSSFFGNTMFYTTPYFYMFLAMASGKKFDSCS